MNCQMLSKINNFYSFKSNFKPLARFYCKSRIKLGTIEDKCKKPELLQQSSNIITESYEECSKFEEKAIKQVIIEKESDASVRSRLSKDCRTLFSAPANKLGTSKCDSINLDQLHLQWDSNNMIGCDNKPKAEPKDNKNGKNAKVITNIPPKSGGGSGDDGVVASNRPVRKEPGKVILTFIPEEWWKAFMPKTGVTGLGTFFFTFSVFLVSKEIYVLEHYFYHGLGSLCLWTAGIIYLGPQVAKELDKKLDEYEKSWNEGRENLKNGLEEEIVQEMYMQWQIEGQLILMEAKKENVALQLEEEFRKRQMQVYHEVKQRLDYQLQLELVRKRIQQRNLVEYVTREVTKAITPDMQDKLIYYSIDKILDDLEKDKK